MCRHRLRGALDYPHHAHRRAQRAHQKEREKRGDDFARGVGEEAHDSEREDVPAWAPRGIGKIVVRGG